MQRPLRICVFSKSGFRSCWRLQIPMSLHSLRLWNSSSDATSATQRQFSNAKLFWWFSAFLLSHLHALYSVKICVILSTHAHYRSKTPSNKPPAHFFLPKGIPLFNQNLSGSTCFLRKQIHHFHLSAILFPLYYSFACVFCRCFASQHLHCFREDLRNWNSTK